MLLRLENADDRFIKVLKAMAKAFDVKIRVEKSSKKLSNDELDAREADKIIDEIKMSKRKLVSFDEAAKRLKI